MMHDNHRRVETMLCKPCRANHVVQTTYDNHAMQTTLCKQCMITTGGWKPCCANHVMQTTSCKWRMITMPCKNSCALFSSNKIKTTSHFCVPFLFCSYSCSWLRAPFPWFNSYCTQFYRMTVKIMKESLSIKSSAKYLCPTSNWRTNYCLLESDCILVQKHPQLQTLSCRLIDLKSMWIDDICLLACTWHYAILIRLIPQVEETKGQYKPNKVAIE